MRQHVWCEQLERQVRIFQRPQRVTRIDADGFDERIPISSCSPSLSACSRNPHFWDGYRQMPAWEFGRFLTHATFDIPDPPHAAPGLSRAARDLEYVERSIAWTRNLLALA